MKNIKDVNINNIKEFVKENKMIDLSEMNYFFDCYENHELRYKFSLLDFLKVQACIAEKFPNPKKNEIEMMDSFILHIIEEAEECNREIER